MSFLSLIMSTRFIHICECMSLSFLLSAFLSPFLHPSLPLFLSLLSSPIPSAFLFFLEGVFHWMINQPVHQFIFFTFIFLRVAYNCLTTLCQFLPYSSVDQLCVYIHPLTLELPPTPSPHPSRPSQSTELRSLLAASH